MLGAGTSIFIRPVHEQDVGQCAERKEDNGYNRQSYPTFHWGLAAPIRAASSFRTRTPEQVHRDNADLLPSRGAVDSDSSLDGPHLFPTRPSLAELRTRDQSQARPLYFHEIPPRADCLRSQSNTEIFHETGQVFPRGTDAARH